MKLWCVALNESLSVLSSSRSIAHVMCRTLRDLFVLYRTIIPATFKSNIVTTPRTADFFVHILLTPGL